MFRDDSAKIAMPVWVDQEGGEESLGLAYGDYGNFALSPDGNRLALVHAGANRHIRLHDLEDGSEVRLTFEGNNRFPVWSPDGDWIVFMSDRRRGSKPIAGTRIRRQVAAPPGAQLYGRTQS